ncbi:MAG: RNA-binding protein [Bryobacteraceae bacterium]|nr:RNA-binding protein [Bryobacteraceae bacterium]
MKRLFVGNIPYSANEADLHDFLARSGVTVETVSLIRDRSSGEPRGFGFIELGSDAEAEYAIQSCNGKEFLGRMLVVNEARPLPDGAGRAPGGRSSLQSRSARGGGRRA